MYQTYRKTVLYIIPSVKVYAILLFHNILIFIICFFKSVYVLNGHKIKSKFLVALSGFSHPESKGIKMHKIVTIFLWVDIC